MSEMHPFAHFDTAEVAATPLDELTTPPTADAGPRKPRVAIMGEFSAGKSTLSNLLLGARPLPEKVTATRLSPVWISQGAYQPYRVDVDGSEETIRLEDIESVPVENTRVIRMFLEAEVLNYCDLIDFPGISDPNMDSVVWERVLDEVDMVLWCTHATQAWRQSEAAVWEMIPEAVRARSVLLITRFDKLTSERDRGRVLNRVTHETKGLFQAIFPISLTQALAGAHDPEQWISSGADAFADHLIAALQTPMEAGSASDMADDPTPAPAADTQTQPAAAFVADAPRVVPRRVRPVSTGARSRPPA